MTDTPREETVTYDANGVFDFTPEKKVVQFRIDDDVFTGVAEIPTITALRFSATSAELDDKLESGHEEEIEKALTDVFRMLLTPASADRLLFRLTDTEHPIGYRTFTQLIPWLMEQYGMRPTTPSSPSADGAQSPDDGMNSEEKQPGEEWTSSNSDSTPS